MFFKRSWKRGSSDGRYDEFSIFLELYRTNFLTFQGVISAIKAQWKSNEENLHNNQTDWHAKFFFPRHKILRWQKQKKTDRSSKKMDRGLQTRNPRKHRLIGKHSLPIIFSVHKNLKTNYPPI